MFTADQEASIVRMAAAWEIGQVGVRTAGRLTLALTNLAGDITAEESALLTAISGVGVPDVKAFAAALAPVLAPLLPPGTTPAQAGDAVVAALEAQLGK